MAKTIGIDLGTTNSVVAVMDGKDAKIIVNQEGERTTPSVVAWDADGQVLVGQVAKRQAITNPENTVYSAKRFIGRRYEEAKEEANRVPYAIAARDNGDAGIKIGDKAMAPPEISAHVLRKLKQAAEDHLGEEISEAVITVPAYFNDSQRQATKDAGRIAGLEVKRIINEPTAAALAYGLDRAGEQLIAVYDFGGGTFDISVLEVSDNVVQVVSTNGDTNLGGDDLDRVLMDHLLAEFKRESGLDVQHDKMVVQRLRDAAESAKKELSSKMETSINLPFLTADASGPKHFQTRITRAAFEALIEPLVNRSLEPVKQALADAGKAPKDIDEVVLIGGSTRIPMVQAQVKQFFGKDSHRGVNPDEVVAVGAAIQGGVLAGEVDNVVLLDVTPLSLGLETLGRVMTTLIPRNTTIPTRRDEVFSTADDQQASVEVHVLQGERANAADNRTLGRFHLQGIAPAPRGVPKIKVTFDIDANGILSVTALDEATGKDQQITITANSGLGEAEIEAMVEAGRAHEADDQRRREQVDARNQADALCYSVERSLAEYEGQVEAGLLTRVKAGVSELKKALEAEDPETIAQRRSELEALAGELARAEQASTSKPSQSGEQPDIIDAEFEEGENAA
ncbi:MAG: molecular chaperone DnaK [Myxococcales bacterium]|nr:molecular chaperone DnaK [Myxococcales bacterium]